ncbi:MAG: SCP2 sterol-binding domain-containing protein [Rhodanobacter sp.]|jgi:putative sterol carrier protein|nr:SCP2 sterol-binding domain-containing protein [Rhodanobacter sp.]
MSALDLLNRLPAAINAQAVAGLDCTLQFNTSQPAYVVICDGACLVTPGVAQVAHLTLTLSDEDLAGLLAGRLDGMMAVMTGKLKLQGDLGLAQQLGRFFDASRLA